MVPPVLTVTLIFCPGFKLVTPTAAFDPDGFGTTFTGSLLVTLNPFFEAVGLGDALLVTFGEGVELFGEEVLPSMMVTFIFCPGFRFSIPTFAEDPVAFGLMASFLVGEGAGLGVTFGDGEDFGDGLVIGFGVTIGFGITDGLGEGVGEGVGLGFPEGVGEGVGVGLGFPEGVGEGVGVGLGDGDGEGVGLIGADSPPLGAGAVGVVETFVTCSGMIGSEGRDGEDSPTDVTVVTVNVYGSPFVSELKRIGEEVTDRVSPVSTTVMMYPVIAAPLPVAPLNSKFTLLFPGVPVTTVGALGVPAGVPTIPFELAPRPTPFSAATVNV